MLKRYPRYSETFVLNEILAHEAAGLDLEIFSLLLPEDGHFQDGLARVRAAVTYLPETNKATDLWTALETASALIPEFWSTLQEARGERARYVHQAVVLAAEVRRRGITQLHAHFATAATTVARLAARLADVPFSFTAHAKDIFHETVSPDDLARKLSDAAAVITVSDFNLAYLRRTFGSAAARVERLYNGLELNRFPFESPAKRPPRIIGVGRLIEKKGFETLIEACRLLAERDVAFECEIVGAGLLDTDLRAQIVRAGLAEQVQLLGPRPQSEVTARLRNAAAFAAPCVVGADGNRDGLPTVLLEAMAIGTPCVATDVTGIPEIVRHEQTGLQVPQHDPEALARAIERLLNDADLRVALARRARQLVESSFDIVPNTARLREIFSRAGSAGTQAA